MASRTLVRRCGALALVGLAPLALAASLGSGTAPAATSRYALRKVVQADSPVGITVAPGTTTVLVIEQVGRIRPIVDAKRGDPVLDISGEITSGGERGLLGVAWSAAGDHVYVDLTNRDGDTEIREYAWSGGKADPASKRLLLKVEQPYSNHNGGQLVMDASGLLWIGMGDGGSSGDPQDRAQDTRELLGKILRIDPRPSGDKAYSIPQGNPFADGKGGAPEVWAYGLRNPWRFTLDAEGRRLIIADVGQGEWEEIDVVPLDRPGANLGWNLREGKHAYDGGSRPAGAIDPVYEYSHSDGCSVTGGAIYRGSALPELRGLYLFGDYCRGWIAALRPAAPTAVAGTPWVRRNLGVSKQQLTSFGTDAEGEVWVTFGDGSVMRLVRK